MNGDTTYALNDLLALADRLEAKRHAAPDADADAFRRGDWRTGSRCRDGPDEQAPRESPSMIPRPHMAK